jgi:endonuclease/exonuclease/phosphatase (EEP) superfamily protein YafD
MQLRRLARLLPAPGTAAVVAGDCNFWGPGVETLLPGWRRAVRGRTWPARAPHSQIDHVLTRPGDVAVLSGRVLADVGSDHRAIRVELAIRDQR